MSGEGILTALGLASIFWVGVYALWGWPGVAIAFAASALIVLIALMYFYVTGVPEDTSGQD